MIDYYYLASSLPSLEIGEIPRVCFGDFIESCRLNLDPEDLAKTKVVRRWTDVTNLGAFFRGDSLDPRGNVSADDIEDMVMMREGFSGYICDFLKEYDSKEDRLRYFPRLLSYFFKEEIPCSEGFLHEYLRFERDFRLVMTGFRSKILGRDVSVELQYEDPDDIIVAQILAQKDSPSFEPPVWFSNLKEAFEDNRHDPIKLHKAMYEYRFSIMERLFQKEFFSMDRILGYMTQLIIVEKWLELDEEKGKDILKQRIGETSL